MILNTNSWHFKLVDHWSDNYASRIHRQGSVSLCSYFWRVVFAILWTILTAACVTGLAVSFLYMMVFAPLSLFFTLAYLDIAVAGGIIWLAIGAGVGAEAFKKWRYNRKPAKRQAKPDNLVVAYIKAKKAKVCPILKVQ